MLTLNCRCGARLDVRCRDADDAIHQIDEAGWDDSPPARCPECWAKDSEKDCWGE